jgi:hypothetical protein
MTKAQLRGAPEVLAAEELLGVATVAWYDELLKGYVDKPDSRAAKLLAIDGFVIAIRTILERDPTDGPAILAHLKAQL